MATELIKDGVLEITDIAANWDYKTQKPDGWPAYPRLMAISFNPGAADDALSVKHLNEGGPHIMSMKCQDTYDQRVKYFHGTRKIPFIDFSECTLSAGHIVTIELWRE